MSEIQFPLVLETQRLVIRPADVNFAAEVNEAVCESQPTLAQWMPWADHVPTLAETWEHLFQSQRRFEAGEDCGLCLWNKVTNAFVGGSGLHPRSSDPRCREIGYWVRDGQTGRGYATEAVQAIAAAGFRHLNLKAIEIRTSSRNVASQAVARRAGFSLCEIVADGRIDPDGVASKSYVYVARPRPA